MTNTYAFAGRFEADVADKGNELPAGDILVGCALLIIAEILKVSTWGIGVELCLVGLVAVCCAVVPTINTVEESNRVKRNLKYLNNYLNTAKEPFYFWGKDNQMCEALKSIHCFKEL